LPWANMKFSVNAKDGASVDEGQQEYYKQWSDLGIPALGEGLTLYQLARYKYHIDIGGEVAGHAIHKLVMPGLLFHPETKTSHLSHLIPWVHYIPVNEDLSDLKEKYEWAETHDQKARLIANAGTEFVQQIGQPKGMEQLYQQHFLKPLEDVLDAYEVDIAVPLDLMGGGLLFEEIMRCDFYNIHACPLKRPK